MSVSGSPNFFNFTNFLGSSPVSRNMDPMAAFNEARTMAGFMPGPTASLMNMSIGMAEWALNNPDLLTQVQNSGIYDSIFRQPARYPGYDTSLFRSPVPTYLTPPGGFSYIV